MAIKQDYKERAKLLVTKSRLYRILFGTIMCAVVVVGILATFEQPEDFKSVLWLLAVWVAGILMGLIIADSDIK